MSSDEKIQDMFYRANIAYHPILYGIPPEMAVDSLLKINAMISQITFGYALVDRPEAGFYMHFIFSAHQEECPGDGYFWLDDETTMTFPLEESGGPQPGAGGAPCNKFLHIFQRKQGVCPGENCVSMIRRRYQLVIKGQPLQIQLMHYLSAEDNVRNIIVNPSVYKLPARRIQFPRPSSHPPLQPMNQRLLHNSTGIRQKPKPSDGPVKKNAPQDASPTMTYDAPVVNVTHRDVATLRFSRNHDWMESIFTPTQTSLSDPTITTLESLKSKLEALEQEDIEMNTHVINPFTTLNAAMKAVEQLKTPEEWSEHIKTALDGALGPYQSVTQVNLSLNSP